MSERVRKVKGVLAPVSYTDAAAASIEYDFDCQLSVGAGKEVSFSEPLNYSEQTPRLQRGRTEKG